MKYVEVIVASASYHGVNSLTYSTASTLAKGTIVDVPLRRSTVSGVVVDTTNKPAFPVLTVTAAHPLPPLPSELIDLLLWMKDYYPSSYGALARLFLPSKVTDQLITQPKAKKTSEKLPPLTVEQTKVLKDIQPQGTHLLFGETGSGKTRVYIELAKKSLSAGKSVLILTPEIGLTSQLAGSFREVFGEKVWVLHSQLTQKNRHEIWSSLLQSAQPVIVIGPRSALFSPVKNLGLIVIDEAHDTAYKQDQAPYYHASRVAAQLASLHHATLVLASATPLVSDYFIATKKGRPILRMKELAIKSAIPKQLTQIVDQRDRTQFTKSAYISNVLLQKIKDTLEKKEQVLLFLNHRGTARTILCEHCGWQALCPHCDLPVVYHADIHKLRCHSCSYSDNLPGACPVCQNPTILFKGIGTKAITDQISRLLPEAHVMRFDADNKKAERLETHYQSIKDGDVDILVGTQLLSKGLDLPHLGLVGIISADTGLCLPDFSAEEKTYQLLSQVIGRIGRGHRSSQAILQTYNPSSALIKTVVSHDWLGFYKTEIEEREKFLFPPFCHLLKISCRRAKRATAEKSAVELVEQLKRANLRIEIEGPTPALHEKVLNKYQWQIIIKSKQREELLKVVKILPSGWTFDIDVMDLL